MAAPGATIEQGPTAAGYTPAGPGSGNGTPVSADADSSFLLVRRAHAGDPTALNDLCARYLPRLHRWAHGRLPASARGALDTYDIVQETLSHVARRIQLFEPRGEGAFQAYVRSALMNRIRDVVRTMGRRGPVVALDSEHPAADPSPLELAIGTEQVRRYDAALQRLRPSDREAIVARVELGLPYVNVATVLGKPSAAAAHMAVSRALVRLAKEMADGRER